MGDETYGEKYTMRVSFRALIFYEAPDIWTTLSRRRSCFVSGHHLANHLVKILILQTQQLHGESVLARPVGVNRTQNKYNLLGSLPITRLQALAFAFQESIRVQVLGVPLVARGALEGCQDFELRRAEALDVNGAVAGIFVTLQNANHRLTDTTESRGRGLDIAGVQDLGPFGVQVEMKQAASKAVVEKVPADDGGPCKWTRASLVLGCHLRKLLAPCAHGGLVAV